MRTLSILVSLVIGCAPVVPEVGGNVVEGQPGTTAAPSDESDIPAMQPHWQAPVSALALSGTSTPEWTHTWFVTRLALDEEGNLLEDQPTGDNQPMITILVTTERLTDSSHNGWLEEAFGNRDFVTVSAVDFPTGWIYDADQLRQGLQVIQVSANGEILGYMQPEAGNSETSLTFSRCDGCDPPN